MIAIRSGRQLVFKSLMVVLVIGNGWNQWLPMNSRLLHCKCQSEQVGTLAGAKSGKVGRIYFRDKDFRPE
jgi:hypothetical protein